MSSQYRCVCTFQHRTQNRQAHRSKYLLNRNSFSFCLSVFSIPYFSVCSMFVTVVFFNLFLFWCCTIFDFLFLLKFSMFQCLNVSCLYIREMSSLIFICLFHKITSILILIFLLHMLSILPILLQITSFACFLLLCKRFASCG